MTGFQQSGFQQTDLQQATDRAVRELRRTTGGVARAWLDRLLAGRVEYFDRPDVSADDKLALAADLHRVNVAVDAYATFLEALEPHILEVSRRHARPARLLEIACGFGEFTLELTAHARTRGLPVEVTGSDIVQRFVDDGAARARSRSLPATFRRLDALDLSELADGAYDIVFIAQSLHHFTPGQIALLIAQSRRVAKAAFVGIDGRTGLVPLRTAGPHLVLPPLRRGPLFAWRMWHDGLVSAARFLPAAELELIGRLAAPEDVVRTRPWPPYHTVLEITTRPV